MDKKSVIFILGLIFINNWKYGSNPNIAESAVANNDYSEEPQLVPSTAIETKGDSNSSQIVDGHIAYKQTFEPQNLPPEQPTQIKSTKITQTPKESFFKRIIRIIQTPFIFIVIIVPTGWVFFTNIKSSFKPPRILAYNAQTSKIIKFVNDKTTTINLPQPSDKNKDEKKKEFEMYFYGKVIDRIPKIQSDVVKLSKIESYINPYNKIFNKFDENSHAFDLTKALIYLRFNDFLKLNINYYENKDVKKFIEPFEKQLGWLFKMFDYDLYEDINFTQSDNTISDLDDRLKDSPLLTFFSFVISESAVSQYKNASVLKQLFILFKKINESNELRNKNIHYSIVNNKNKTKVDNLTLTVQLTNEIKNSSNGAEKTIEILKQFEKIFNDILNKQPIDMKTVSLKKKAKSINWYKLKNSHK